MQLFDLPHVEAVRRLRAGATVWLTVDLVEYHGPHLPLHTDRLLARGLARDLSARMGEGDPLFAEDLEVGVDLHARTGHAAGGLRRRAPVGARRVPRARGARRHPGRARHVPRRAPPQPRPRPGRPLAPTGRGPGRGAVPGRLRTQLDLDPEDVPGGTRPTCPTPRPTRSCAGCSSTSTPASSRPRSCCTGPRRRSTRSPGAPAVPADPPEDPMLRGLAALATRFGRPSARGGARPRGGGRGLAAPPAVPGLHRAPGPRDPRGRASVRGGDCRLARAEAGRRPRRAVRRGAAARLGRTGHPVGSDWAAPAGSRGHGACARDRAAA